MQTLVILASQIWQTIFVAVLVIFSELKLALGETPKKWIQAGVKWWYGIYKEPNLPEWSIYLQDGTETHTSPEGESLKIRKHTNDLYEIRLVSGGSSDNGDELKKQTVKIFQIFYFVPGKEPVALDVPRNHWVSNNDLLSREYVQYLLRITQGSAVPYVENYILRAIDLRMRSYEFGPNEYIHLEEEGAPKVLHRI